jgi:hypothetical protein
MLYTRNKVGISILYSYSNCVASHTAISTIKKASSVDKAFSYVKGSGVATASSNLACSFSGTFRNVKYNPIRINGMLNN